jgi:outer membrane protein assembly factor BamD (BamD/ComL family)
VPEPSEIPEDLSTQEYFQLAQEAVDQRHFETALVYYRTFLERHPDDVENRIAAQYEIAFLHYKMEDYDTAEELFEELLARYEGEEADQLPAWPRILAEKLLEKIEEEREAQLVPDEA